MIPSAFPAMLPAPPAPAEPEVPSDEAPWLLWGPYLSERQWGTVREDASPAGDAWSAVNHDMARSFAYRWGEEGIGGISDERQRLCLSLVLWNGQDPILKEQMFGLSNSQGNHGEDVKEVYHYLDNLPDHRYMRMLYRYPQGEFPYARLVQENGRRTREDPEYELADTGIFDGGRFFDVVIEIAKQGPTDLLLRYTAHNRADVAAPLHLLPTLWFRADAERDAGDAPVIRLQDDAATLVAEHASLGRYAFKVEGAEGHAADGACFLFTDNSTNLARIAALGGLGNPQTLTPPGAGPQAVFKDGIDERVVHGRQDAVRSEPFGTKAAAWRRFDVPAGGSVVLRVRLTALGATTAAESPLASKSPALAAASAAQDFAGFDAAMAGARGAADAFYDARQDPAHDAARRRVQRQAWAGLLWNKQFYAYDVRRWLAGDPGSSVPPATRKAPGGRNTAWQHLRAHDVILMPDKWEYPWFAAWDLAFHCIALAPIDPAFAKKQITLLLHDRYMHPSGQLPAYEWNFSDVNPPVQALAAWKVYQRDAAITGKPDTTFLRHVLHRLMLNFTWWVNREDQSGNNIFEGGFLGLDNVGVFDRSKPLPGGGELEQADGTSWMAMYALNLMRIAMELAQDDPVYEDLAIKFAEHFFRIAGAMANMGNIEGEGLWDEEDGFYYDLVRLPGGGTSRLRLRTIAGLIPLFAVEVLDEARMQKLVKLRRHLDVLLAKRPDLDVLVSHWRDPNVAGAATGAGAPATPGAAGAAATPGAAGAPSATGAQAASTPAGEQDPPAAAVQAVPAPAAAMITAEQQPPRHLFSLLRGHRMKLVLQRMLDEHEFLSPYGIRSVSRAYGEHAFDYALGDARYALHYTPAESDTDMFGGNSNWRGPVWMPINFLIVESLLRFHSYYGDDFRVECPSGSGKMCNIGEVAEFLRERLLDLFRPGADGHCPGSGARGENAADPDAPDGQGAGAAPLLFHEYFHGDTGRGLGASHQTGWTALAALL